MACGFAVHKAIGPGYGESIYKNAFCVELRRARYRSNVKSRSSSVSRQASGDSSTRSYRRGCVIVELKAVKMLKRVHEAQVLAYLKASRLPVALLMNFGGATLKEGLKRVVL